MMALTSGITKLKLSENEVCYNTEKVTPCSSGGSLKMYIPKLMANIGFGKPITLPEVFGGDSVFANDNACKPGSAKTFNYKNWLEPKLTYNSSDWDHIKDGDGNVPLKTKFTCSFANNSIDRMTFSTDRV